jgi:hypothetical protein
MLKLHSAMQANAAEAIALNCVRTRAVPDIKVIECHVRNV